MKYQKKKRHKRLIFQKRKERQALRCVRARHIKVKERERKKIGEPLHRTKLRNQEQLLFVPLSLPENFSFIENPEEVLNFLSRFGRLLKEHRMVLLDFRKIVNMTSDAILLLVSKIADDRFTRGTGFIGKTPDNLQFRQMLVDSGFFKYVQSGLPPQIARSGLLEQQKGDVVSGYIAQQARLFTANFLYGSDTVKIKPLYSVLIECMANTRNHAAPNNPDEKWWLSVYNNPRTKTSNISFIDNGVGIIESVKLKFFKKISKAMGLSSESDILREVLEGKIASRTGQSHRGKGLPGIYGRANGQEIYNLKIISNRAFVDVEKQVFRQMNCEFVGTLLYWEIKAA